MRRVVKVISDFVEEKHAPERTIRNYADWLYASFGKTFAETFPDAVHRESIISPRLKISASTGLDRASIVPVLKRYLLGALSPTAPHVHYVTNFRYPSAGGFVRYLTKFVPLGNLKLGHELTAIDPKARELTFSNGLIVTKYDQLVSSVPLPELIPMIKGRSGRCSWMRRVAWLAPPVFW